MVTINLPEYRRGILKWGDQNISHSGILRNNSICSIGENMLELISINFTLENHSNFSISYRLPRQVNAASSDCANREIIFFRYVPAPVHVIALQSMAIDAFMCF